MEVSVLIASHPDEPSKVLVFKDQLQANTVFQMVLRVKREDSQVELHQVTVIEAE